MNVYLHYILIALFIKVYLYVYYEVVETWNVKKTLNIKLFKTLFQMLVHTPFKEIQFHSLVSCNFIKSHYANNVSFSLLRLQAERIESSYVLVCAGLHADDLARCSGCDLEPAIVPFRGEYLLLNPDKQHLIRGNIYPVRK